MFHCNLARRRQPPAHRLLMGYGAFLLALLFAGCDLGTGPAAPVATPIAPAATAPGAASTAPGPTAPPAAGVASATPLPATTTPVPPTATPVPPSPTPAPRALTGHVLDAYTGRPVPGARLTVPGAATTSQAAGDYDLGVVPPGTAIQVAAAGYASISVDSGSSSTVDVTVRPTGLHGRVTDASTGKPLRGVIVRLDLTGAASVPPAAPAPTGTPAGAAPMLDASLRGPLLAGVPLAVPGDITATATLSASAPAATSTPVLVMPTPYADKTMILAVTDADGNYSFDNVPQNPNLTFKEPGYKLMKVQVGRASTQDMAMPPFMAKAIYMTANAAAYEPLYKPMMDLADNTEINAIVLNLQNDRAEVAYNTKVQMAISSGAVQAGILPNIKDVVADFHKRHLYVIARLQTFMQPAVADANPQLAVHSKATGKPWKGGYQGQQRWLDPSNPASWAYPIALAREAVDLGFDEVQFDYIRFPSDPAPGETWEDQSFFQPADDRTKPLYIQQFETAAHNMLNQTDAFMSVDIFGYTVWPDQNGQPLNASIGQVFERMVGSTDFICPMVYPSHFSKGEMGFPDPNSHPYEIIKQAGIYTSDRLGQNRAKQRPWLQGFDWNHLVYDGHLYRLQKQAALETGASGWMFWDPSNIYSADGFDPKP